MKNLSVQISSQKAFTLVELMIALSIFIVTFSLASYGVIRFKQSLEVTNAAKEMIVNLRKARRYAIDGVVTDNGTASYYYIDLNTSENSYNWGACSDNGQCEEPKDIKSPYYKSVEIGPCVSQGASYSRIRFEAVTGQFIIENPQGDVMGSNFCEIELETGSDMINTTRKIRVDKQERTIKFAT